MDIPAHLEGLENLTVYQRPEHPDTLILHREQVFGITDSLLIDFVGSMAVDDSGRVYVTSGRPNGIKVFDPDGRYLTQIGREGRGPGEFVAAPGLNIISNQLYVVDYGAYRISIFSVDSLKLIRTVNINLTNKIKALADYAVHQIIPDKNGAFLVCFKKILREVPDLPEGIKIDTLYRSYYPINKEGRLIPKQVLRIQDQPVVTESIYQNVFPASFNFFSKPLVVVSNNGSIYTANSKDFLIKEYSPDGEYRRAFFHPYHNVSLTREIVLESNYDIMSKLISRGGISENMSQTMINSRLRLLRQIDLPPNWPALNDLLVDDENRLWLSTIVNDQTVYQWWVLDENGKLLAGFQWPRSKAIKIIKNGCVYTEETNKKTGLERVVRYKIAMSKG
ncbi:6-bladed beta-propeller [Fodinibius roseus]|uniref:6-bladed beta-propeller n=1 Tax=Fodinibius roseus TaxID=1194090 RepID=UPI0009330835|nr:6-bladed beta-propeller [Fodinibius roseus]